MHLKQDERERNKENDHYEKFDPITKQVQY